MDELREIQERVETADALHRGQTDGTEDGRYFTALRNAGVPDNVAASLVAQRAAHRAQERVVRLQIELMRERNGGPGD